MNSYVSPEWGGNVELTKRYAIRLYDLRSLGWKGFDELEWVAALLKKHPKISTVLIGTLKLTEASFNAVQSLADTMKPEERYRLRDYIIGKLALEELSCNRHGSGAGSCETRTALHRCVEIALEWE
ncbi:MAG: hypothetical protein SGJ27_06665 [Candidatus Melainabacteria bacterium]|nr:hypothetical protein [Candidatus Melainabacteria bacterium]